MHAAILPGLIVLRCQQSDAKSERQQLLVGRLLRSCSPVPPAQQQRQE